MPGGFAPSAATLPPAAAPASSASDDTLAALRKQLANLHATPVVAAPVATAAPPVAAPAKTASASAPLPGSSTVRAAEAEAKMKRMEAWVKAGCPGGDFEKYDAANGGKPAPSKTSGNPAATASSGGIPSSTASSGGITTATSTMLSLAGQQQEAEIKRKKDEAAALQSSLDQQRQDALIAEEEQRKQLQALKDKIIGNTMTDVQKTTVLNQYKRKIAGVDLVFVMDCTGSMSGWISECVSKISSILDSAATTLGNLLPPGGEINIAFVGYRDYCDGNNRSIVHDFIPYNRIGELKSKLAAIRAFGGCGGFADVASALYNVSKLSWGASTKLIICFSDAPAHGSSWNDSYGDPYPGGDPEHQDPEKLMSNFCAKGIDFHFVEIDPSTVKMMNRFFAAYHENKLAQSGSGQFYKLNLGYETSQFLPSIVKAIKTTTSSRMNYDKIAKMLKDAGVSTL